MFKMYYVFNYVKNILIDILIHNSYVYINIITLISIHNKYTNTVFY